MTHVHTFTSVEAGVDQCLDCDVTVPNPVTADQCVALADCRCGRGLARFVHGDHFDCGSCFSEHVQAERLARQGVSL
jgi:hypothetical protein